MSAAQPAPRKLDDLLARLAALHPKRIDLDLSRMHRILEALDHPERRLPPVIHVAGTNGKGSTVAFLRAICEAAGLRVHVYTSPHLVRLNERFRIAGELASDAQLEDAFARCERANGGAPITLFEIETAAAFLLFSQHIADVLLLEVGLGGRLDATNVVETPLASVITPVGLDHFEFLGDTLIKIATEKAGIIKRNVPVIVAEQQAEAQAVIEQTARKMRAPLFCATQEWHVGVEHGRLVYHDERGLLDVTAPRLFGRHQFDNAGLAIATLRAIPSLAIEPAAFEQGVVSAQWPARMQRLPAGTLATLAPQGCELWLDGGHNADGGRVAAAALADLGERVERPVVLIVGMMGNKDARAFLANFSGLTRHVLAVPILDNDNAMEPEALAAVARSLDLRADVMPGVTEALARLASLAYETPPRILITGSLYLAGHVLAENGTPPG
ncbi:FolC bifunctional protein [Afipia carboxidovorans OM5]|uniref:Dihydrofolate synthase/folylpolyglutamate synthase n=1 Tax=Afipia carboxidovorans (strain ATCC 49405 / DSM 1227 / KCTC 32145 / OM5) TaxID=504832 RepID=B6JCP5_AFIC5|nr:folylpolyglutamate synthase/dihydrofolate synthase family protein [Afipia carboxidovorans]ACI91625.1 FolC bifunctional protein [Afipia carboxidovorans OM5]AEI01214.1 folylpolyglutamate synthase Fgs [Afipia carboxidovorans OM4]AEI04788.1 folylpolyglutamate synthase Fgs [Afipia carboxidovorans OM5]BEV45555.1 folylpolyglutamate synthase/dihydrofolate synthase family protein [Afipia carboxidovorans]